MIMYTLVSCFYLAWIIWHVMELRKIRANHRIYDRIPGYEEYRRSEWYRLTPDSFSRGTYSGASCRGRTLVLYMALLFILNTITESLGTALLSKGQKNVVLFYGLDDGAYISLLFLVAYDALVSWYLPVLRRRPVDICFSLCTVFPKDSRTRARQKCSAILLAASLIVFPFRLMMLANHGIADSEKIVYRPFFSRQETVIRYDQVLEIEPIYTDTESNGEKLTHCYLVTEDGTRFDLLGGYRRAGLFWKAEDQIVMMLPDELKTRLPGTGDGASSHLTRHD